MRQTGGFIAATLVAAAVPFVLSACTSNQTTGRLATKPAAGAADTYGYAPVRVTAFADGTRIAMPTSKPDLARMSAAGAGKPAAKAASVAATAPAPAETAAGEDAALAALKADVAERKAEQASQAVAELSAARQAFRPGAVPPAPQRTSAPEQAAVAPKPQAAPETSGAATAVAALAAAPAKGARVVAGGAKQAVETTIETVGEGAEAARDVTVAAIDTTVGAARKVRERLGDTFKGTDTITGDARIDRLIEAAAAENHIPAELAYAVVRVESHYNPTAIGGGAYGLSQIKPATARGLGFAGPATGLFDPETNLRYGMKYLAGAWQRGDKDICRAAMKYKGGHRTTRMSRSAAVYCSNVKRHMAAIERRRAPANRGVVVAAAEREKTIAVASRQALPGVPEGAAGSILGAAASQAGRHVANAAPVPSSGAIAASAPSFASPAGARGGRVGTD